VIKIADINKFKIIATPTCLSIFVGTVPAKISIFFVEIVSSRNLSLNLLHNSLTGLLALPPVMKILIKSTNFQTSRVLNYKGTVSQVNLGLFFMYG